MTNFYQKGVLARCFYQNFSHMEGTQKSLTTSPKNQLIEYIKVKEETFVKEVGQYQLPSR